MCVSCNDPKTRKGERARFNHKNLFVMKIMDMHGHENDVASNSKGNTGVTLGAIGTGLGILNANNNGCGGGLLGGLFGGNRGGDCHYESKEAALLREQVATLKAENYASAAATRAFTESATYTNRLHDEQAVNIRTLLEQSITQGVAIQRIDDKVNTEVALLRGEMNTQATLAAKDREALAKDIQIEAERRSCSDNSIVSYVNQTFYPKQVADVETSNDTTSQTTYNPIPCYASCYCK